MARDDNNRRYNLNRRKFIGATGIGLFATGFGGSAGAVKTQQSDKDGDNSNGGGGNGGNGGGGNDDDDSSEEHTVTLITGHTIHVTGDDDQRQYAINDEDAGAFRLRELEEGTYIIPNEVDLDRLSLQLFNIDFLIEQGLTDHETDTIPVIVELDATVDSETRATSVAVDGFMPTTFLSSIDSVAGEVVKKRSAATTQRVLSADSIDRVHLDIRHEALLDTSADAIGVPAAREQFDVDGSGVSIAVLDTGIDADHPDFGDRVVYQEDFTGDGIQDHFGHGTHCAGIAAGAGTVSDGQYIGMAPGADLLNIKVLGDRGRGLTSSIVDGIEDAIAQGVDVVNMSLGGPPQKNSPLVRAVNAAVEKGIVAVVAAGNTPGYQTIGSPGNAESAITVGASNDEDGGLAQFSSGGPTPFDYRVKPEVLAPGVHITSTGSEHVDDGGFGGGGSEFPYTNKSGTSMATPHIAGLSALLLERDPGTTPDGIKDRLIATADPLADTNVYRQGSGEVNATAALGSDLRVHDAVVNFGLYEDAVTDSAAVTIENTGAESMEVDVSVDLVNVQSDDTLDENASVSPSTLTVDAGATETIDVTIDTSDTFGFNSGVLTFATDDGKSRRTIFGFVRGLKVTVEKIPHPRSNGVEGDTFDAWSHDSSVSQSALRGFDSNGQARILLLSDGGEFTFWSAGHLDRRGGKSRKVGEPTMTVESNVQVNEDNTHFTIDESSTVPRVIDTRAISDHAPLKTRKFVASLHANIKGGETETQSISFIGDLGIRTVHVSPIDEPNPTNVSTEYLMTSEEQVDEYPLDTPVAYHLFYGSQSIDERGSTVTVDSNELAEETFEYHRNRDGQRYGVAPFLFPADRESFPTSVSFAGLKEIDPERVEQTWYRTAQGKYLETWYEDATFASDWEFNRMVDLVPKAGATYRQAFNREPLVGRLSRWTLKDSTLDLAGHWYADQADEPFDIRRLTSSHENKYTIRVDGTVVDSGRSTLSEFSSELSDLDAGSEVEISQRGNTLRDTSRRTTTATDYRMTYKPGAANTPPQIDTVDVTGLDVLNEVPAGQVVAFVDIIHEASDMADYQAFYAPTGTVSSTPFENPSSWQEAEVLYSVDGLYAVLLDTTGYSGTLELAMTAVDSAGNRVESTTFDALTVRSGAQASISVEVRPNSINLGSNQNVPVLISGSDDVDTSEINVDTLRFGSPQAVVKDGGAAPVRSQHIGRGGLQVHFTASETGYSCTDGPVAGQIAGELADGTPISGVDVIPKVICKDRTQSRKTQTYS